MKYADDTYIIPASNSHTRSTEIDNVEHWAQTTNLKLNRQKFKEIVFVDNKRNWNAVTPPPSMQSIARVTSIKILGVTIINGLSASNHIRETITNCPNYPCTASFAMLWPTR